MASQQNQQGRPWLLTALIVLISLIGLASGALTRTLLGGAPGGHVNAPQATLEPTATFQPAPTTTTTLAPTSAPVLAHFTIHLTVSPAAGSPGATITINAVATDNATGAPIPGLTCRLREPTNGAPGLFTTWPTPDATDSAGIASWTAQIPSVAPGRYVIEVFAQTPSWSYIARASVFVQAP